MYPTPPGVARALRQLGEHVSIWRKLNRLPASVLAERARISRDTLRSIEQGTGTASSESVFRVLRVLGVMDPWSQRRTRTRPTSEDCGPMSFSRAG